MGATQGPNWYLREWMNHFGKRQSDMVKDIGWDKGRASRVYNVRDYRRELVNDVSAWLHIEPYELLMPPAEALAIRGLRETARQIVAASAARQPDPAPKAPPATRRRASA